MLKIKTTDLYHGVTYAFKTAEKKLAKKSREFPELRSYLDAMHQDCPDAPFFIGPRSSAIHAGPLPPYEEHYSDEFQRFVKLGLRRYRARYSTAHEQVQMCLLERAESVIAVEVPVWSDYPESQPFEKIMQSRDYLSGHIDVLAIDKGLIWVWDYKPNAHKERWVHTQLLTYVWMLSKRTGIPIDYFRCGYFDDQTCQVFSPTETYVDKLEFYSFILTGETRQRLLVERKPRRKDMEVLDKSEMNYQQIELPRKSLVVSKHPLFFPSAKRDQQGNYITAGKKKKSSVLRRRLGEIKVTPKERRAGTTDLLSKKVKQEPTAREAGLGCLVVVACIYGFSLVINMWGEDEYVRPEIDQEEIEIQVRSEEPKIKPYTSSPPSRSTDHRFAPYEAINIMAAVAAEGRVRFGRKYPVIGIRKSATEISLNEIVSGETLTVEKYEDPFFAFQWSASDKLMTRINAALTENILLEVNQEFGLAQLGQSQVALLKLFPKVEPLGVITEKFPDIKSFSVNQERSKVAYVRVDGNVLLGEKDETGTFAFRQMCVDPESNVVNVGLFSGDKVVIGGTSGEFAIYESSSELPIRVIDSLEEGLTAFAVSPDNSLLVAGYASGMIAIYSLTGPEHLEQIRNEMIPAVSEIVFRKDSEAFAVVTNNGEVVTFGTSYVVQSAGGVVSETEDTNELLQRLLQELKKNSLPDPFAPN
ncbi:PD-(D/E)XK nuclease family protein [Pirellulaceae bacterium]|nr:PD-(D/E)XK nuclease family protein [Pirellulaceae bacterium]